MISGKSVIGCIHLANKTPMMRYSKKQATTETATFGAEFIAARTCIEQIIDLRNSLRYLGVRVNRTSYMFGDNELMINNVSIPCARLHKWHHLLSFHYVRSHIAQIPMLLKILNTMLLKNSNPIPLKKNYLLQTTQYINNMLLDLTTPS